MRGLRPLGVRYSRSPGGRRKGWMGSPSEDRGGGGSSSDVGGGSGGI